jgi:hypothetical protein
MIVWHRNKQHRRHGPLVRRLLSVPVIKQQMQILVLLSDVVPTFVDRGVLCGQCGGSPTVVNLIFLGQSRTVTQKIW